jgi:hypothetical protein
MTQSVYGRRKIFISQRKLNVSVREETVQTSTHGGDQARSWNADFGFYFWTDGGRGEYRALLNIEFIEGLFQLLASVLTEKFGDTVEKSCGRT